MATRFQETNTNTILVGSGNELDIMSRQRVRHYRTPISAEFNLLHSVLRTYNGTNHSWPANPEIAGAIVHEAMVQTEKDDRVLGGATLVKSMF